MPRPETETVQAITGDLESVTDSFTGEAGGPGTFRYRVSGDEATHEQVQAVFDEYDVRVDVEGDGTERSYYLTVPE